MKWTLETRFGHNDQWTSIDFDTEEGMKREAMYKFLNRWEVRISHETYEMALDSELCHD